MLPVQCVEVGSKRETGQAGEQVMQSGLEMQPGEGCAEAVVDAVSQGAASAGGNG